MKIGSRIGTGESVIAVIDDHWMSLALPFFLYVVGMGLAFIFLAFWFFGQSLFEALSFLEYLFALLFIVTTFVVNHWLFIYLFRWELSAWVVTDKRIIDFNFLPYVQHDVSFVSINEIHEIEKHKHGLLQNVLGYGEVFVSVAAATKPVHFKYMPYPSRFVNLIESILTSTEEELDISSLRLLYKPKL